ncbi:MAG: Flp family type IVb pilin [Geminicoccaceae bacterium]
MNTAQALVAWGMCQLQQGVPLMSTLTRFLKDEKGATMIEYGLIAALVAVAAIAILTTVGNSLVALFTEVNDALAD